MRDSLENEGKTPGEVHVHIMLMLKKGMEQIWRSVRQSAGYQSRQTNRKRKKKNPSKELEKRDIGSTSQHILMENVLIKD